MRPSDVQQQRELGYQRVWGRPCEQVFHQTDDEAPHVDVYRYAPTW